MKIVLVGPANSIHLVRWANSLQKRNNEVFVFSCKNHQAKPNSFSKSIKISYLKYNAPLGYYFNARGLRLAVASIFPDVVNVHYASGYGTLARKSGIERYLLSVWGSDIYVFPNSNCFNRRVLKKNLAKATFIASTSKVMAIQTKKFTNKAPFITPFGVDISLFSPQIKTKKDYFLFGTVKGLEEIYGIKETLKSFIALDKRLVDEGHPFANQIRYEIYGSGSLKNELEKIIEGNQLIDKVFLKGYVQNNLLPSIISNFDVFCANSKSESFGVAAIEAMACGVPVIVSNAEGFTEVVVDMKTGIIVPINDIEATTKAMYELLNDNDRRKLYGENARKHVEENYDWEKSVDIMESIYREM